MNQLRVLGSHNSYKRAIPTQLLEYIASRDSQRARAIDYHHPPIQQQLDQGLRQLEIDVVADQQGGYFSNPFAVDFLAKAGVSVGIADGFDKENLSSPGFKVLHIPDIDVFTHCATFEQCLRQIRGWSEQNPSHEPLYVLMNVKEKGAKVVNGVSPLTFDRALYGALDAAILQAVGRDKLIVPDDIRGSTRTLRDAVLIRGWPKLSRARGKVVFIFDGNSAQIDLYRQGHASLAGRVMFASVAARDPEAAIMVVNDPVSDHDKIQALVASGFIVRTRSDLGYETLEEMRVRYKAAVSSGAQIISSDFYPGSPNASRRNYEASFPGAVKN